VREGRRGGWAGGGEGRRKRSFVMDEGDPNQAIRIALFDDVDVAGRVEDGHKLEWVDAIYGEGGVDLR